MDAAKNSVKSFMAKAGHHDTTVHETVAPAVTHEVIKPRQHEEVTTAIDKEVHQDHYHRTVQPIHDREILPEQHTHNMASVQHREVDHRDHDETKARLAAEAQAFRDQRTVHDTKHTQAAGATIGGEHVHHHIHENIQPVVHKEVIQPNVVHTTVPIHEVHHKAATHHSASELPPVSMAEFKNKGGALGGREERYDGFEGEPKNIGGVLGGIGHHSHGEHKHGEHHTGTGLTGSTGHAERTGLTGSSHHNTGSGLTGSHTGRQGETLGERAEDAALGRSGRTDGQKYGNTGDEYGNNSSHHTGTTGTTNTKPSMLQKLNPFSDTDGDGKKGLNE